MGNFEFIQDNVEPVLVEDLYKGTVFCTHDPRDGEQYAIDFYMLLDLILINSDRVSKMDCTPKHYDADYPKYLAVSLGTGNAQKFDIGTKCYVCNIDAKIKLKV